MAITPTTTFTATIYPPPSLPPLLLSFSPFTTTTNVGFFFSDYILGTVLGIFSYIFTTTLHRDII